MNLNEILFIDNLPRLDLHGLDRDTAAVLISDFVKDNVKMNNKFVVIIHGIGENILRNKTHEVLKNNKNVEEYKLHMYNAGCTVVKIKL